MPQKGGNLQAGKFGQIDEGVVRQDGHHVVTQIEPGKRTQMAQSLWLDGLDFVDVEIKFSGFRRYVFRNFTQLGTTAANNGTGAGAFRRAIILSETSLIIQFRAAEFKRWHVLQRNVFDTSRAGAAGCSSA